MKDELPARRITRHQKSAANAGKSSPVSVKSKKATSPKAVKVRSLKPAVDKSKSPQNSRSPKNSKSPKRTSPRKTIARNLRSVHTLETMTPRRETRRAARLAQRSAAAKTINEEPKETSRSSSILQTLKQDVEEQQKSSRANSSEKIHIAPVQYKPPTKDELMLFGEPEENPLMKSKKAEAQTEIVATKNLVDIPQQQFFTDDEDDQDMNDQLQKEKEYMQKTEFIQEEKLNDMGKLFGMSEEEVQAIAEKQKTQIQKMKEESVLFGDGNVEEFQKNEPFAPVAQVAEVQNEHIMQPEAAKKEDFEMQNVEEKEKSFEIEVAEAPAEPELTPAELEYQKKQEELNRQIEDIKRQIKIQQEEQEAYEKDAQAKAKTEAQRPAEVIQVHQPAPENQEMESEEVHEIQVIKKPKGENIKLPEKYELLLKFVHEIDQAINMLQIRSNSSTFSNIKQMIETQTNRQFNMTHFQQILSLSPSLFLHKWEMKHSKLELIIQAPANIDQLAQGLETIASEQPYFGKISEKSINLREKAVKSLLVQKCICELEKSSQLVSTDSAISMSLITNEQVSDIALAELKEQPRQVKKTSMNDFISTHDKQQIYVQALEEAKRDEVITKMPQPIESDGTSSDDELDDSSEEAAKRANKFGVSTGISPATVQAIQFKQKAENEMKTKTADLLVQQDTQKNIETLMKISEQIKSFFQMEMGSKKFLNKLIDSMM